MSREPLSEMTPQRSIEHLRRHAPNITRTCEQAARGHRPASAVHFRPGAKPWSTVGSVSEAEDDSKIITSDEIGEFVRWLGGHGCRSVEFPPLSQARWRAFATQTSDDQYIVMMQRLFSQLPSTEEMCSSFGAEADIVSDVAELERGLVVIAGASASGKSTTLAGIMSRICEDTDRRIVTIESPIERVYPSSHAHVTQHEIRRSDDARIADGERLIESAINAEADVIVLSDLRTTAEAIMCIAAANAGCLVLTTMHAMDVSTACERLTSRSTDPAHAEIWQAALAESYQMVVCQRMIPDADDPYHLRMYGEVVPRSDAMVSMIRSGDWASMGRHVADDLGDGLDSRLVAAVEAGEIIKDHALSACHDRAALERRIG